MKPAVIMIAGTGIVLLLSALFIGYTQASAKERVIITHALTEWSLAKQARERGHGRSL